MKNDLIPFQLFWFLVHSVAQYCTVANLCLYTHCVQKTSHILLLLTNQTGGGGGGGDGII